MQGYRKRGILIANVRNRERGISAIKEKKIYIFIYTHVHITKLEEIGIKIEKFSRIMIRDIQKNAGNVNCRCEYRRRDMREPHTCRWRV